MTLKAFLFLFVVTMVAVVASAFIAERLVGPGLERGVIIAVLAGLVVFPAARWAEHRGWIKGDWSPGGTLRKAQDARKAREAQDAQNAQDAARDAARDTDPDAAQDTSAPQPLLKTEQIAGRREDRTDPPAGAPTPPGDPR